MVEVSLPLDREKAGAEYYRALVSLGLIPEALFWVKYDERDGLYLLLISSHFDDRGPLEITKLLFKAYNASALPKEIDPFEVDVYSPKQILSEQIFSAAQVDRIDPKAWISSDAPTQPNRINIELLGMTIPANGIYVWEPQRRSGPSQRITEWKQLVDRVQLLAA